MLQLPLFPPPSDWRAPSLADLPSWAGARRVAIDVETRDPDLKTLGPGCRRRGSYIVGFSFAIEGGPAHYVPVRHAGGDNVDSVSQAFRYLREQAAAFDQEIVGANLSYDLDWLSTAEKVEFPRATFRDVLVADPLIDELQLVYSLESAGKRWGVESKDMELLEQAAREYRFKNPRADLWQLPARYVGAYAARDAVSPLEILRKQEEVIEKQGLRKVWDLESAVLPVLTRMRQRGVRIDFDRLEKIEAWALTEEAAALARVRDITGVNIAVGDVWRAEALAPALKAAGVPYGVTGKTKKPQIDRVALSAGIPLTDALLHARKVNKLRTTFAASIKRMATNGRIHATFNQLRASDDDADDESGGKGEKGAKFGRVSSDKPNLQQQPSRDKFAPMWRSIYTPEEGMIWACCDYSQQEPRWTAHMASLVGDPPTKTFREILPGAHEMVRRYCEDPNLDNHTIMSQITGLDRKYAKAIFLGLCYGEGGAKLCRDLGLPTEIAVFGKKGRRYVDGTPEAAQALAEGGRKVRVAGPEGQAIIDKFNECAPYVRGLAKRMSNLARSRGYIRTVLGRRCRFPKDEHGNYDWLHAALNRLIQGSGADQMKQALVNLDAEGVYLQLQVHDEVNASVPTIDAAKRIGQVMADAVPARVPFKVDVECGPSWGEIKLVA